MDVLKLNVRENAYGFVEESLRYAELAVADPRGWKFAIILAAQAIELLLKARLADVHPLLVLSDIDRTRSRDTVGVEAAITRLTRAGVSLDTEDIARLRRARHLRNEFVHFEVNASIQQLEAAYADLFEFAHYFHLSELGGELHEHLSEDLWPAEAAMMERFRRELVVYQGAEVFRSFPAEIIEAQFATHYTIDDEEFARFPYGRPDDMTPEGNDRPCHDCSVLPGQYHAFNCDMERCPKCLQQLLGCGCQWEVVFETDDGDSAVVAGS